MANQVLKNAKLWLDGYDLSGHMSALALNYGAAMLTDTALGDDTVSNAGGIKTVTAQHEGYWDETPDGALLDRVGLNDKPMTISPTDGATGSLAYFFKSSVAEYSPGGSFGEMLAFSVSAEASGDLIRGSVLLNASALIATGDGAGAQVGAVATGETLHAALHVLAADGSSPTIDVVIESDVDNTFATPATQITFAQASAIGSQYMTAAGPITDTWYRVSYTIGGTSPSFDIVVALGIR